MSSKDAISFPVTNLVPMKDGTYLSVYSLDIKTYYINWFKGGVSTCLGTTPEPYQIFMLHMGKQIHDAASFLIKDNQKKKNKGLFGPEDNSNLWN